MALNREVADALLTAIKEASAAPKNSEALRNLAEAYSLVEGAAPQRSAYE